MIIKIQDDIKDCGLSVLQAFHAYFYNRWININHFKRKAHYGLKGVNIEGICNIAKAFGMKVTPLKGDFESFMTLKLDEPIIALIGSEIDNHYIIVNKIKSKTIHYSDSITGKEEVMLAEEFSRKYLGIIMKVEKTQYSHKKVKVNSLYQYVFQFKKITIFLIISILISSIVGFSSSWFIKVIMDQIIPGALNQTLKILFIGFLTLTILGIWNSTLRNYVVYKISLQISCEIIEKFNRKLLESNYLDISKLSKEDIMKRASFIETIALFISSALFSIISEVITCITAGGVLIWLNQKLFLIALLATILLISCSFIVHSILNRQYGKFIKTQVKMTGSNLDLLSSVNLLKTSDFKDLLLIKQGNNLYKYKKQDKKIWNINNWGMVIKGLINSVVSMLIIFISTKFVIGHQMTIGSMILFTSMFTYFMSPTLMLVDVFIKYPLVKKEMDMLMYILDLPSEKTNPKGSSLGKIETISLKKLSFGFEDGKEIINVDKISLKNNTKIIGKNGSGKSTLFDIISTHINVKGLYFNNIESKYYSLTNIRDNTFKCSSSLYVPRVTILEYATKNNAKRQEEFMKNIKKFKLNKIFVKAGISLDMTLLNNAQNISAGQRQLIQLLPLFTKEYKLILFDEAFENIDARLTKKIMEKIKEIQKEAFFLEISHSNKFINRGKEVKIEKFK